MCHAASQQQELSSSSSVVALRMFWLHGQQCLQVVLVTSGVEMPHTQAWGQAELSNSPGN
jgi:hypothetical protein